MREICKKREEVSNARTHHKKSIFKRASARDFVTQYSVPDWWFFQNN
jgi:hypothetical protein